MLVINVTINNPPAHFTRQKEDQSSGRVQEGAARGVGGHFNERKWEAGEGGEKR